MPMEFVYMPPEALPMIVSTVEWTDEQALLFITTLAVVRNLTPEQFVEGRALILTTMPPEMQSLIELTQFMRQFM